MIETFQDLHHKFPAEETILQQLKTENPYFRNLSQRYSDAERAIRRLETDSEEASADDRLDHLRKYRRGMLDEVAALIALRRRRH